MRRALHFPAVPFCAAVGALFAGDLPAVEITASLQPNIAQTITLAGDLDDDNFREPLSYRLTPPPIHRFIRRVTLSNTGTVPLTGRLLVVNGQDWSSSESLHRSLRLPPEPAAVAHRFFRFWWDHRAHASSGLKAAEDPIALLNFWGYSLCGEDAVAAPHFLATRGISARRVRLIGHVASEYQYDGGWHLFDGDQNACYLRLDNTTVASAADIHADPFLVLRTKVFGRNASFALPASAYNASLFDRAPSKETKPFKPKPAPMALRDETLLPGETLTFHYDRAPDRAVGSSNLDEWKGMRGSALGLVEHRLNAGLRRDAAGVARVTSPEPILRMANETTGAFFEPPRDEVAFEASLATRDSNDVIAVFRQRARVAYPPFRKGRNEVSLLAAEAGGTAAFAIDYDPHPELTAPSATLRLAEDVTDGAPTFAYQAEGDRLWWQIATTPDFLVTVPNFDAVIPRAARLELEALSATFLQPGVPYFARLRAHRGGVWGAWSAPVEFAVQKPAAPSAIAASVVGGRLRLNWKRAAPGDEYLVFGSNRLDFVPEILHQHEIAQMENQTVLAQRPNQNLIAVTPQPTVEFTPACRFYRIIARAAGRLSVPSELIRTPPELTGKLPPATALRMKWERVPTPSAKNGYLDSYLASEAPLPDAAQ